jgi:hypothetical protein
MGTLVRCVPTSSAAQKKLLRGTAGVEGRPLPEGVHRGDGPRQPSRASRLDLGQEQRLRAQAYVTSERMKPEVGLRSLGDNLMPNRPSEPSNAMNPPAHAKPYKISMTLLIILGTWGIVIALFYWASFYD